jgi:hypothetical protein
MIAIVAVRPNVIGLKSGMALDLLQFETSVLKVHREMRPLRTDQ